VPATTVPTGPCMRRTCRSYSRMEGNSLQKTSATLHLTRFLFREPSVENSLMKVDFCPFLSRHLQGIPRAAQRRV